MNGLPESCGFAQLPHHGDGTGSMTSAVGSLDFHGAAACILRRIAKYNHLRRIARELGVQAQYADRATLRGDKIV